MICPSCGSMNDEFQTICNNCGEPLTPGFVLCPHCGKVLKDGTAVCTRCGINLLEKTVNKNNRKEKVAFTPKYVVKAPLSMPAILSIMIFMAYTLIYNIFLFVSKVKTVYSGLSVERIFYLFFSNEVKIIVLVLLLALSLVTFIQRIAINRLTTIDELNKRLTTLKCLLLADVTGFFTYFLISFWPTVFVDEKPVIYYVGAILGLVCLIVSLISLPLFYKKAKVRTR